MAEKKINDEEIKDEEIKESAPDSDGLIALIRDGVTIRRPAEQANALVKRGWVRA